jgi:hypothetical protein
LKLFNTNNPDVKDVRTLEYPQKIEVPTPDKDEVLSRNHREEYQQCEVTMLKEDKTQNGKRTTEMKLTEKKDRKLSKKRAKIENLQKVPEGTSQTKNLQNGSFAGISE